MAKIKEIDGGNYVLGVSFTEEGDEKYASIEYYRGKAVRAEVPEEVDGFEVRKLCKKAFLGAKTLTRISLPGGITEIGDWAFASCSALTEIVFPKRKIEFGSGLFKDCGKLERIVTADNGERDLSYLFALAVSKMDAAYLLDLEKGVVPDWIAHFDSVILQILGRDDTDGFSKMLLCGEEDYVGDDSNLDTYILLRKKEKIRILLTRLIHDTGLSAENREVFTRYLKDNMDKALWPLVLEEHGEEREYFDLLIEVGCINPDNVSALIDSMGDRYTGMKGYLIRYKGESGNTGDFLDSLDL